MSKKPSLTAIGPEYTTALLQKIAARQDSNAQPTPSTNRPAPKTDTPASANQLTPQPESDNAITSGRYDFDLAEFPMFQFYKNRLRSYDPRQPLTYEDTITGQDGVTVTRRWKAFPSPYGFGGPSTQDVLYELLQLYVEQGARGQQIQFGTLRALYMRIHAHRATYAQRPINPRADDYNRLKRDLDILSGYRFEAENAFWDKQRQAYVDMRQWSLFTGAFYFKPKPNSRQEQLPFGFIGVHPVLREIARSRGFFAIGFDSDLFHSLKPTEQRLAIYLAKKFMSQKKHQRYLGDLARALPLTGNPQRTNNLKRELATAANGLLRREVPILKSFAFEKSPRTGEWLAVFHRAQKPKQDYRPPKQALLQLEPAIQLLVDDMIAATDDPGSRLWWSQCADRLGRDSIYRALGQLKETCQIRDVRSRGGMLTKILKDIAKETGRTIH